MKKWGIVVAIVAAAALLGCASTGGGAKADSGGAGESYTVDLSKLVAYTIDENGLGQPSGETVRNKTPFARNYDNLPILFSELPDVTKFSRVTIKIKCFAADGSEITPKDGNAMVSLFYDPNGDIFSDGSKNLIIKEFNVGGFSGSVSNDRGVRMRLTQNPGGILLQNSNENVKFIELTEVKFHNGD